MGSPHAEVGPADPVVRWTPPEAWLIAELTKRALVVQRASGEGQRAGASKEFSAEVVTTPEGTIVALTLGAGAVSLQLDPQQVSGHRWRDGWAVELERPRDGARWMLRAGDAPIAIAEGDDGDDGDDGDGGGGEALLRLCARPRVLRRALVRELAGEAVQVPIFDAAFHRYTRQSTAMVDETEAWMAPTLPEPSPWWELDLGVALWLCWLRVDLAVPAPGTRVVVRAYGVTQPNQQPWPQSIVFDGPAEALAHPWITIDEPVLARFVRVELHAAEGAPPVVLRVTAAELHAAELHPQSLPVAMKQAFARYADRALLLEASAAGYAPARTYEQVWEEAMALGRGLAHRLEGGERVVLGVMTKNRPEWIAAELAGLERGYLVVAMSPDDADDRLGKVLERAKPTVVICEAKDAERLARLSDETLRLLVMCEEPAAEPAAEPEPAPASEPASEPASGSPSVARVSFSALIAEGLTASPPPPPPFDEEAPYMVLFTSGSTGTPKGAVRSYRTFFEMQRSYALAHSPRHLSFQPLSHLSERVYLPALFLHGGCLAFSRGGAFLMEELAAFAPSTLSSVPRLFEVLHAAYQRRLAAAQKAQPAAPLAELRAAALAEARGAFGENLLAISVGSAPVSAEVLAFLKTCFADLWVTEGYGSTEVGSIAFNGKIAAHVEVKLVPRPGASDAAPTAPGEPERGEIYVRTPHTISGYLGDPEATARAIGADGFFATGDLGERDPDGSVRVIGRVHNTVKLAQGEFLSIERVEVTLTTAPIADRVFVHVAHGAAAFAALVVPHADALARSLQSSGEPPELAALLEHPRATAVVLAELRGHGRAAGLLPYELPRAVLLSAEALTVENGLLTASGKLARGALTSRYGADLAALAAAAAGASAAADSAEGTTAARLCRIAGRVLGRAVADDAPLGPELGVDSLVAAELIEVISGELGRELPLAWWFEAKDLRALAARLDGATSSLPAAAEQDLVAADLAWTPPAVVERAPLAPTGAPHRRRAALVTGATGLLGSHLVAALAARDIAAVCLVRAPDEATATARLATAFARRQLAVPASITVLPAELGALDAAALDRRAAALDLIVHAGATVSWLAPYAALRGPNVHGTTALLELAARHRLPFHHVSTISTAPASGDEHSFLPLAAARAGTPYGLSKWIAEENVRRAAAAGLPCAVYRPAMIAADTKTGIGNPDDFLVRYMAGCLELGLAIDRDDARLDFTPVDFVASAIAALIEARPLGGGTTYTLCNIDQSPSFAALGRAMAKAGAAVALAPYPTFRAALLGAKGSRLHPLAAFFPEEFSLGMGPWPCAETLAALDEVGVARPAIDDEYLARLTRRILASNAPAVEAPPDERAQLAPLAP